MQQPTDERRLAVVDGPGGGEAQQLVRPVALEREQRVESRTVRYRTVGDMSCTGAVDSDATDVAGVILELAASRLTERGATRADDRMSEAAMEDRKKQGYF